MNSFNFWNWLEDNGVEEHDFLVSFYRSQKSDFGWTTRSSDDRSMEDFFYTTMISRLATTNSNHIKEIYLKDTLMLIHKGISDIHGDRWLVLHRKLRFDFGDWYKNNYRDENPRITLDLLCGPRITKCRLNRQKSLLIFNEEIL